MFGAKQQIPGTEANYKATEPPGAWWCACVFLRGTTVSEQPVNVRLHYLGVFSRAKQRVLQAIFKAIAEGGGKVSLLWQCSPRPGTRASQPRATRAIRSGLKTEPRANHSHQSHGPCADHGADDVVRNASGGYPENASRPAGARGLGDDGRRRHRCYASTSGGRRANDRREAGHAPCRESSLYGLCLPRRDLRSYKFRARRTRSDSGLCAWATAHSGTSACITTFYKFKAMQASRWNQERDTARDQNSASGDWCGG